jgi:aspartate racemase
MRVLGMLGGMAWPSTLDAYRLINEEVGRRLGGVHSAELVLRSFDFAAIEALQDAGDWDTAGRLLADAAAALEQAGAEGLFLCTNTMHKLAPQIEAATSVPLLHIADVAADAVTAAGIERVALLGTRFTMEEPFYRERLAAHGLDVLVPDEPGRDIVHRVIYDQLVKGEIRASSRDLYLEIIAGLVGDGAQGVIAGCTEIELLITPDDVDVPWFPTTTLHTLAAVDWMLA